MSAQVRTLNQARAVAALMVAFCHCLGPFGLLLGFADTVSLLNAASPLQAVASVAYLWPLNGALAVHFFFVLSGFVLRLAHERHPVPPALRSYRTFVIQRSLRLWPAHLAALALILLLIIAAQHLHLLTPLARGLVTRYFPYPLEWPAVLGTVVAKVRVYNPVSWTLRYEFFATLYILPLIWLAQRLSFKSCLLLFAALFALTLSPSVWFSPFDYIYMFFAGITAATYRQQPAVTRAVARHPWLILLALILATGLVRLLAQAGPAESPGTALVNLADALLAAVALLALTHANPAPASPGNAFSRALTQLGQVSYSFYLLHYTWMFLAFALLLRLMPPVMLALHPIPAALAVILLSMLPAYALARLSYRLIETPAMRLAKRC